MIRTLQLALRRFADLPPHTKLGMPSLSPTMTTGIVVKWLKKEGEKVKAGENMFEVETDKATVAFEVQDDVYLAKIIAEAGSSPLPLGAPVAILVDKADRVAAFSDYKEGNAEEVKRQEGGDGGQGGQGARDEVKGEKHFRVSPAAQNLIHVQHIDPAMVPATGPKGLILKEDVVNFVENSAGAKEDRQVKKDVQVAKGEAKAQESKGKTQDKEDKGDVRAPRFSVTTYINLEKPLSLFQESHLRPFLIKAASSSCKAVPESHSKFFPTFTRFYDYIDTQVYIYGSKSAQKYFIQDTQKLSMTEISSFLSSESSGSPNFEISFGTTANEVSNPRTSALLSLSPIHDQVISSNDELKSIKTIKATLNCDHRAVDGAVGANWLKSFKQFVENPVSLI